MNALDPKAFRDGIQIDCTDPEIRYGLGLLPGWTDDPDWCDRCCAIMRNEDDLHLCRECADTTTPADRLLERVTDGERDAAYDAWCEANPRPSEPVEPQELAYGCCDHDTYPNENDVMPTNEDAGLFTDDDGRFFMHAAPVATNVDRLKKFTTTTTTNEDK